MAYQFFVFRVGQSHYAVPFRHVERVVSPEETQSIGDGVLLYQSERYFLLSLPFGGPAPTSSSLLLLKDAEERALALPISRAFGIEYIQTDALHPLPTYIFPEPSPALSGCFSAAGQLVFAIDLEHLKVNQAKKEQEHVHQLGPR